MMTVIMVRILITIIYSFIFTTQFASAVKDNLEAYSRNINKSLPEVFDHATKLMRTRAENNHLNFDFIVRADKEEFAFAFPKVRSQVLGSICKKSRERTALQRYQASVVYRYENEKGQTLGEFMVKPNHCGK